MLIFGSCCRRNKKREFEEEFQEDIKLEESSVIDPTVEFTKAKVQNAVNFFLQLRQNVPESITFLQITRYKGVLRKRIKKFTKLFSPDRQNPVRDIKRFFVRFDRIVTLLLPNRGAKLTEHIQRIAYHTFLSINARSVHQNFADVIFSSQKRISISYKLELPKPLQSDLMQSLVLRYNKILFFLKNVSPDIARSYILPNVTYKVVFPDGKELSFFRSKTFASITANNDISNIFKVYLKELQSKQVHHLDLSLMGLGRKSEAPFSKLRHELQDFDPKTLFSWAFDFYAYYQWNSKKTARFEDFLEDFVTHFLDNGKEIFRLPPSAANLVDLENDIRNIIKGIHEDFFFSEESFEKPEFEPFVFIVVIHLIEYFCEKFNSSVCTTACHCHIDRGMVIMTLLFHYLQIKSGQESNQEYLKYIETMVFVPALLYANRPPHECVMNSLFHALALFHKPGVVQNIKKRETYFSNIQLHIPCNRTENVL